MIKHVLPILLVACSAPQTASTEQALSSIIVNGSFETGDYTGWTLSETPLSPTSGTWGIALDGQTIGPQASVFDFFDHVNVQEFSPGLPITYDATDGTHVALQLQNGGQTHRMSQVVTLPACQPLLLWDMQYRNHFGAFDASNQYIAINVRDAASNAVLATPFKTNPGDPLVVPGMLPFRADLTPFAGQTVRLEVEQQVQLFFFDAAYDNVRVVCRGIGAFPGAIDFGTVSAGTQLVKTVFVENFANVPLTVSSLLLSGPFELAGAPALPQTLMPGQSVGIDIAFAPAGDGPAVGLLTIDSDDPNGATNVSLAGIGRQLRPQLVVGPTSMDFGAQRVGSVAPANVRVTNLGTAPATLGAPSASAPFVATSGPVVVGPASFVDIPVAFAPVADGPVSGQLTIVTDDPANPTIAVALFGAGVSPQVVVAPGAVAFGSQRVGTASPPQTIVVSNPGTAPLAVSSIAAPPGFVVDLGAPLVVAAGDSVAFHAHFAPGVVGPAVGAIALATDAGTAQVDVSGAGVAPAPVASPLALAFGNVRVGTTATRTFVVENTGSAPYAIGSVVAEAPFVVAPAGPQLVLPGGRATFTVTFAPAIAGAAQGAIAVIGDADTIFVGADAIAVHPVLAASGAIDFGDVRAGQTSAPATFTVSNPGNDMLAITAMTVPAPFALAAAPSLPIAIAPGVAREFAVVFAPTSRGPAAASVALVTDAGAASVGLAGRGIAPAISPSLDRVDFGAVAIGATASLDVQLSNTGDAPLAVTGVSGAGDADFTLASSIPTTVAPGQATTIAITFAPHAHGPRALQLAVASDAGAIVVPVAGTGSGPRAVVSPSLDFGAANVGTAADRAIDVANAGDADLVVSAIVVGGAAAADFTAPTAVVTIAPGASASFAVTFRPSVGGPRAATATLVTTDPLVPSSQVALAGTGTSPALAVAPGSLDFGDTSLGGAATRSFTIANTGTGPLAISALDVSRPELALAPVALPLVLAPSETRTLSATFRPTALGAIAATIAILSDATTVALPVVARGVSGDLAIAPAAVDFGAQMVGRPSALRQVHVANTGTGPLAVTALGVAGGAEAPRFALVSPPALPATIAAGGELVLSLRVTPDVVGAAAAQLAIATSAGPAVVPLAGLGVASALAVTPSQIDFGTVHAPAASTVTVTLTNLTADTLDLRDATRGGGRPDDFTVGGIAGSLAPGASVTATVSYTAAIATTSVATIAFAAKDPTVPTALVTVAGKAVSTFLAADRAGLDFGAIQLGDHSGPKSVTLTNTTTAALAIASIVAGDAQFVVDAPPPMPIAPGASISFTVAFVPATVAPASSHIAITLEGAASPELLVSVEGEGTANADTSGCNAGGSGSLAVAFALLLARRRRQ